MTEENARVHQSLEQHNRKTLNKRIVFLPLILAVMAFVTAAILQKSISSPCIQVSDSAIMQSGGSLTESQPPPVTREYVEQVPKKYSTAYASYDGNFTLKLTASIPAHSSATSTDARCNADLLSRSGTYINALDGFDERAMHLRCQADAYPYDVVTPTTHLSWVGDRKVAYEAELGKLMIIDITTRETEEILFSSDSGKLVAVSKNADYLAFDKMPSSNDEPSQFTMYNRNNPENKLSLSVQGRSDLLYDHVNDGFVLVWRTDSENDMASTSVDFYALPGMEKKEVLRTSPQTVRGRGCASTFLYSEPEKIHLQASCYPIPNALLSEDGTVTLDLSD